MPLSLLCRHFALLLTLVLIAAGCSSTQVSDADLWSADQEAAVLSAVSRPDPEDYPVASFEGDSLYQLLVAEVAGHRAVYDLALGKYVAATQKTRDPGVAARATQLALYMKEMDAALETAMIWTEEDPRNIEAHRHVVDLLLGVGRLEEAIEHMEAVKNLGGPANFTIFAHRARYLDQEQKQSLLLAISRLLELYPDDEQLQFSKVVLLEQIGEFDQSIALVEQLLESSNNINVVMLKVSLLESLDRGAEARAFLENKILSMPENRRLLLTLARLLFEQKDLDAAREQYLLVLEQSSNDGDILLALALIALEQQDDEEARRYLERMVRWDRRAGEAHYYLGGIAERQSDTATAIQEYKQVGDGYVFLPAQASIATLLADNGRWDEAREHLARTGSEHPDLFTRVAIIEAQLLVDRGFEQEVFQFLDEALEKAPDKVDLLYFRAMTGQRFGYMEILESNLRKIISLEPDNADALNALGYTLTDQTDRHEEALMLIKRALALKPGEAAFIDSLGWVQYRLQNYEEALTHLRRAFELLPNDEIAAHLGEVLWTLGDRSKANAVWERALEMTPDSGILNNVIRRFREP